MYRHPEISAEISGNSGTHVSTMFGDHHCDAVVRNQPCRTGTHRLCRRIAEHEGWYQFLIGSARRISSCHSYFTTVIS